MEIARTRYSIIKIEDDSKVVSNIWKEISFDETKEFLKKIDYSVNLESFDIVVLPIQKRFAFKENRSFAITPKSEIVDKAEDRLSSFLHVNSDLLNIHGDRILSIFFCDDEYYENVIFVSRLEVLVKGSANFFELFIGDKPFSSVNSVSIKLLPNSHLTYFSFENSLGTFSIQKRNFSLDKDSKLNFGRVWLGNSRFFSFDSFFLEGERSFCSVLEVVLGKQKKSLEINSRIEHIGEATQGYLSTRAVMYDSAVLNYVGGAKVHGNSFNSDSYVELKGIKMSDLARVYFVPLMEINTNLVKAKHSSSIGKVGENELFYMMSRGIDEEKAKEIIVDGFVRESISKMSVPDFVIPKLPFLYRDF